MDILKTRARRWSSDCLASAFTTPSNGADCLQRNNDVVRGSAAAALSARVWKRNIMLHNHWRGNINTADRGEISAALKCFIWFSGFKIHYSHVIRSFISGLFDQDYTTISVKTSGLVPPNSSDLSEEERQTTVVHAGFPDLQISAMWNTLTVLHSFRCIGPFSVALKTKSMNDRWKRASPLNGTEPPSTFAYPQFHCSIVVVYNADVSFLALIRLEPTQPQWSHLKSELAHSPSWSEGNIKLTTPYLVTVND